MGGSRDGRRVSKVNGAIINRLSDVSQQANSVFFRPEDLDLVKGSPAHRRRFLDCEIGQISSTYRYAAAKYKKFLRERNALLKSHVQDRILMQVLVEKIAELTGPITRLRSEYIEKLSMLARLKHRKLSSGQEELSLQYDYSIEPGISPQDVLEIFKKSAAADQRYKTTMVGPHRDDLVFLVNGSDLKAYGSQGQQRTAVLSLKLAEIELFKAETNRYPFLLLDDVFSELDSQRKAMLLEYLSGKIQTFISSAESLPAASDIREFLIEDGSISERI